MSDPDDQVTPLLIKSFFLVLLLLIASISTFSLTQQKTQQPSDLNSPILPTPTISPEVTPQPSKATSDENEFLIKAAVLEATNLERDETIVTINEIDDYFATGALKEFSKSGVVLWLAAKDNDAWIVVHHSQDNPSCEVVEKYKIPNSYAPECLDLDGQIKQR